MPADPKGNRLAILLAALFGLTVFIVNGQATVINGSPPTITTTAVGTTSQPTSREQQVLRAKDTQGEAVPGVGLVAEAEVPVRRRRLGRFWHSGWRARRQRGLDRSL